MKRQGTRSKIGSIRWGRVGGSGWGGVGGGGLEVRVVKWDEWMQ